MFPSVDLRQSSVNLFEDLDVRECVAIDFAAAWVSIEENSQSHGGYPLEPRKTYADGGYADG